MAWAAVSGAVFAALAGLDPRLTGIELCVCVVAEWMVGNGLARRTETARISAYMARTSATDRSIPAPIRFPAERVD